MKNKANEIDMDSVPDIGGHNYQCLATIIQVEVIAQVTKKKSTRNFREIGAATHVFTSEFRKGRAK